MSAKGIDVSLWNGVIDWDKVKAAGVAFATVKSSQGGYPGDPSALFEDPQFKNNQAGARRTMQRVGYFHLFTHTLDPVAQADFMLKTVGPLQPREYLVIDNESSDGPAEPDKMLAFLQRLANSSGTVPWVYTSPGRANQYNLGATLGRYPLWLAHYGVPTPIIPKGWSTYQLWQHGSGSVPGIVGDTDLDIAADSFLGSMAFFGLLLAAGLLWYHHSKQ